MVPSLDDLFEVTGAAYKGIFNLNNFRFRKLKEHFFGRVVWRVGLVIIINVAFAIEFLNIQRQFLNNLWNLKTHL